MSINDFLKTKIVDGKAILRKSDIQNIVAYLAPISEEELASFCYSLLTHVQHFVTISEMMEGQDVDADLRSLVNGAVVDILKEHREVILDILRLPEFSKTK